MRILHLITQKSSFQNLVTKSNVKLYNITYLYYYMEIGYYYPHYKLTYNIYIYLFNDYHNITQITFTTYAILHQIVYNCNNYYSSKYLKK